MKNYEAIFDAFHNGLIEYGTRNLPRHKIEAALNKFKEFESRSLSDDEYFEILVFVAFYSGFKAETVTSRREVIKKHFPSLNVVANYDESHEETILADARMIKHKNKIRACINNAKKLQSLVAQHGSIKKYIESFEAQKSFENLMLLKEELEGKFSYLGGVTVYHFLTDIGMPVLKPDRVICRIFKRLGLIENESQLLKTVIHGRKMAKVKNLPVRYIDIVLVAYGQTSSKEFGLDKGICLSKPRCDICKASEYCMYFSLTNKSSGLVNSPLI